MKEVKYFKYSDFGRVTCYEGPMGCGKTLGAVIHLSKIKNKILSNAFLRLPNYEALDKTKFLSNPQEYVGSTLFLDMAEFTLDSRNSQSKETKLWTYFFQISRKLDIKIILTAYNSDYLDKKVRYIITDRVRTKLEKNTKQLILEHYKRAPTRVWVPKHTDLLRELVSDTYLEKNEVNTTGLGQEEVSRLMILADKIEEGSAVRSVVPAHWSNVLAWKLVSTCTIKRVNRYFPYYNTLEILKR